MNKAHSIQKKEPLNRFAEKWEMDFVKEFGVWDSNHCSISKRKAEAFIRETLHSQSLELKKLLEDSFEARIAPVINLDDVSKNCTVCGYDHDYANKFNENAYKLAHMIAERDRVGLTMKKKGE